MSETVCPFCGHSPVPDRAERCPSCEREFSQENLDETGVTRTRLGGLTGAVTAHPAPAAVAMLVGAAWWLLRGTGWLGLEEPWWTLLLSAAHVVAAVTVLANLGPAQHLPSLVAVAGAGAGLVLSPGHPALTAAAVAFAALVVAQTAGDPGPARRWGGAALASLAAVVGTASLFVASLRAPATKLGNGLVTLTLPDGWRQASSDKVAPLTVPAATSRRSVWALEALPASAWGSTGARQEAFGLLVAPAGTTTPGADARCRELLDLLGVPVTAARAGLVAPPAFGPEATYVDATLLDELPARVACVERSGGPLLLVVGSRVLEPPGLAATAFEAVAGGLSVR